MLMRWLELEKIDADKRKEIKPFFLGMCLLSLIAFTKEREAVNLAKRVKAADIYESAHGVQSPREKNAN